MNLKINKDIIILLTSTLIIALCGLLYELLIGATSSYLLGSSITQFSLTIGAFMTSFGIGSYLSRFVKKNVIQIFFLLETIIGFLGSISIISLFYFYSISDLYHFVMYFFIISIGSLVGLEIPLIGRIIEEIKKNLRITLANLFSFDYIGAMIGSIALPLILLPKLGLIRSSILIGIGNLFVSLLIGIRFRKKFNFKLIIIPIILVLLDVIFFFNANKAQVYIEQKFYEDKIIYLNRSMYQKIVITQEGDDTRLLLDGNIQFSSKDEYRYHESMIHIPIAASRNNKIEKVLILGGGDGLAARELLKYPSIKKITICDLDPMITQLFRTNETMKRINHDSMSNPKVHVVNEDAFNFLQKEKQEHKKRRFKLKKWDFIFIDLPDPNNEGLAKLYSVKFYKLIQSVLSKNGVAVTQSTSPYHARRVFWCIYNTIKYSGFTSSIPYKINVPSFGIWGFIMFSNDIIAIPKKIRIKEEFLRFISEKILPTFFTFPRDLSYIKTDVNKLIQPVILDYYEESWNRY